MCDELVDGVRQSDLEVGEDAAQLGAASLSRRQPSTAVTAVFAPIRRRCGRTTRTADTVDAGRRHNQPRGTSTDQRSSTEQSDAGYERPRPYLRGLHLAADTAYNMRGEF